MAGEPRTPSAQPGGTQVQKGSPEPGAMSRRGEHTHIGPGEFFSLSPFALMRRLSDEMDRVFFGAGGEHMHSGMSGAWAPPVETYEREGNLVIAAELPGVPRENLKVEAVEGGILIQGERRDEHSERQHGMYRSERRYGRFQRLVPLPEGADAEKAQARYHDGVLEVTVPVPEQKQKRRSIPIEADKPKSLSGGA